ncbi:MAG TPA: hypothetical protein VLU41_05500 [Ideonella sp.]|nr:hypothetical protein [Ideonella sp.]
MIEAHTHLAYAPRGAGLLYAVLWFAEGPDVFGWYIGSRDGVAEASWFVLPDHYSARTATLYRSRADDLDGEWVECGARGEQPLPRSPVPQALRGELGRLQDAFVRHWLFFDDDADAAVEARAYERGDLPVRHVNIRAERLGKLQTAAAVWRYDSHGADHRVLMQLSRRWPLDARVEED